MSKKYVLLACVMCLAGMVFGGPINVVPKPGRIEVTQGGFDVAEASAIYYEAGCKGLVDIADYLQTALRDQLGHRVESKKPGLSEIADKGILLVCSTRQPKLGNEGYVLDITADRVTVLANGRAGVFYGIQTLLQLTDDKTGQIPCVKITDGPRFGWRGLMLDCSRTFQSIAYLKKTVDRMAAYKMNVLHLHLTDDQGWRLEIK
jgi:hexosaminidase